MVLFDDVRSLRILSLLLAWRDDPGVQLLRGVVDCSTWYVDAHALLSCVFAALAQWVIVRTACCGVLLR